MVWLCVWVWHQWNVQNGQLFGKYRITEWFIHQSAFLHCTFGLHIFLLLDSTLFRLDSTFWLDSTLKLNSVHSHQLYLHYRYLHQVFPDHPSTLHYQHVDPLTGPESSTSWSWIITLKKRICAGICFVRRTLLSPMPLWRPSWKHDVKSKIRVGQSIHIYLRINPTKFHPDPIWNGGTVGFFDEVTQQQLAKTRRTGWVTIWDQFLI